jgi:plasmid maintenance system antidote protein VapI
MNTSSRRKLTLEQAQAIRQANAENPRLTQVDLAARFHTTQSSVSRILAGRLFREQHRKLTEEQVQDVRYIGAGSITEAARKYGITKSEAASIVQGRSYRDVPLSDREIERRILFFRLEAELAAIPSI